MIRDVLAVVQMVALVYILLYLRTEIPEIRSDNALINTTITQESKEAKRCAISALDQLETFIVEAEGRLSDAQKMRREKLRIRLSEMKNSR